MDLVIKLLVIHTMCEMFCEVNAGQCSLRIEYSFRGMMLKGHTFMEKTTTNWLMCVDKCNDDVRCQSSNYVITRGICELNDRTKEARPGDFVADSERVYLKRLSKRVLLGSIAELPAESCAEIKASEGEDAVSGNYWFSSIKPGAVVLAPCNMSTEDVDECNGSVPVCDVNAKCRNTIGSFICVCKTGLSGDGFSCSDVDECNGSVPVCDVNAKCMNTIGSFICSCKTGFSGDGFSCSDIDECASGANSCISGKATCSNTVGSYNCTCNHGYTGDGKTSCLSQECQNYQTLTNGDRKNTFGSGEGCDNSLGPGWFRFQGAAGTKMAATCVPTHRCGTHSTGWLNGAHPTVAEGQVTRQVCFHYFSNCCNWFINIQVQSCGDFFIYYISGTPPEHTCHLRYCGAD